MKTFLIRRRALSLAACAAAVCLMFYVINYPAAVDASASQRQLPIYCVQRDQKLASPAAAAHLLRPAGPEAGLGQL